MKKLTIIDTFAFFFRSFYALPPLKSSSNAPTGLLTGFANFIYLLERDYQSDYILFALDSKRNFRNSLYPEYKANRSEAPEDLKIQLEIAIEWIEKMGFAKISIDGFEADDIIASVVKSFKDEEIEIVIASSDKDLYQLIDERVKLFEPVKKITIDKSECLKKFGITPDKFIDYQALVGDSSDNVPGAKGIGAKSAKTLLDEFGSLDKIYSNIDFTKPRMKRLLLESKELVYISKELVTLRDDALSNIEIDIEEFEFHKNPLKKILDELSKYELNGIVARIESKDTPIRRKFVDIKFEKILLNELNSLKRVIDSISDTQVVAIDIETDSLDTKEANLVGFSFAFERERAYYVPIAHKELNTPQVELNSAKELLKTLLSKRIIGHNLKFDLAILYRILEVKESQIEADTMILAWLLSPDNSLSLDNLALRFFRYSMIKYSEVVPKGENFSNLEIDRAKDYASEDAYITYILYLELKENINEWIYKEAKEVEFPFINTLIRVESNGVKLDIELFEKLLKEAKINLEELTQKIYTIADEEFNINSTKQLSKILFEKLNLKAIKKTKSGYSTDESVLKKLINQHEIIPLLLNYREMFKLKSTYFEPLLKFAKSNKSSRIYTTLLQSGTQTGRLSSKNPNLQNIPARGELAKKVRNGFIADEGKLLIGIDYSQIELRLLAHFSKDENLIEAFREDKDIHTETAIKLFGKDLADSKRAIAKSINFGLIYGMGSRKLSATLNSQGFNTSTKEASEYIESYFENFPTVKSYLEELKGKIREDGYVETLLGRRRFFQFNSLADYQISSHLREGVNTLFQGSAADLIKLAMNRVDLLLEERDSKMLLQIHDELLFEAPKESAKEIALEFQNIMENIYKLRVPLKSSIGVAKSWGEIK